MSAEAALIAAHPALKARLAAHPPWPGPTQAQKSPYEALARAIVYQQLSGKAAGTIYGRVVALFGAETFPAPDRLLSAPEETLRGAGLSRQKIAALKDLAAKRVEGLVPAAGEIEHLEDDEIVARLTAVRGVGRWTVEMYLMFTLGRPDVWPADDLGVRKGAELLFGATFTPKTLKPFADPFRPWRSALAWHCWRATETATPG